MKLRNFEISSSIELRSENSYWDLHNFADFTGLELIVPENAVATSREIRAAHRTLVFLNT